MITLHLGDGVDYMGGIEPRSIDLVLVDPPYGTTACKWDAVIPLEPMWAQIKRILKDDGAAVFMAAQPFTSALVMSNPHWFKYDWVWKKPKGTGHLNAKKMPMRDKEDILVFSKNVAPYNPQMVAGAAYKARPGRSKKNGEDCYGDFKDVREDNTGYRYPKQVLEFGIEERNKLHPTQKPVPLMEYLVLTYSKKNDTVLDFAMGSGTTGVACVNTNRNFIGVEKDKGHYETAYKRINDILYTPSIYGF